MANQSILVTDRSSNIKVIEYKSIRCGMFGRHWYMIDLKEHQVYLTINHAEWPIDQQNNYGIFMPKDRLWLQIDGGPEFEIEDIRVPGCASYQEKMEKSFLCPNLS